MGSRKSKIESVKLAPLSSVCEINPRVSSKIMATDSVSFVPMSSVSEQTASVTNEEDRLAKDCSKGYTAFQRNDVLVAKITPCFENGKIVFADIKNEYGFGSTEFHVLRPIPDVLDARYLLHCLRQPFVRLQGQRRMTGSAGQRRVPANFLSTFDLPLPTLPAQRRIAEILDRAEALRAKRRAALALLDELTQSIFLDMFGDPVSNPMGWPIRSLTDVLSIPLRNGLSPSKSGKVLANVLTLSAITGNAFDQMASKESTFVTKPPGNQSVDKSDFLICRGNGNVNLVGRGFFPKSSMPDTTFPDTMIAARIDTQVERPFLELLWNSRAVRNQIEASARTTNGTYKVNQTMLEAVNFICPPLELQNRFTNRTSAIAKQKDFLQSSLDQLDQFFASLQHRAFRGEI